ncbi:MAG: UDP-glucose/GDP-mannose dehydrogenase family protein [Methanosarcinaceae archaeon]|nr:UDP-glucose/GDP-mannose dehydrogenase family protein [Methanosarcinaceae archaeon]
MRISIFGLGYVGNVSLACLAQSGHVVVGVDISQDKVNLINRGQPPIIEKGLGRIIKVERLKRTISATSDAESAVLQTEVSFICVGTAPKKEGHLDLGGVFGVAQEIAAGIAKKRSFHVVVIRSTVMPGTNQKITELIERITKKAPGKDFAVVSNPEFLREGTAINDYYNPPYTLIGTGDKRAFETMKKVYKHINAPIVHVETKIAELIKYVNNSFHALKICFANEIGSICKALDIDSHSLMETFCLDSKLNLSSSYLKPGFAYGGSCLPKDLRALCAIAHDHYIKCPVLENIEISNETHKDRVFEKIIEFGKQKIGFLGLSFKEGTDDLRSSPIVDILEKLLGKGFDIKIYDRNVSLAKLVGGNRDYIMQRIPFISRFLTDNKSEVISKSDVIVIVNKEEDFKEILAKTPRHKPIFDLVNIDFRGRKDHTKYNGVSW